MKSFALFTFLLAVLSSPAFADTVRIASGEHATFSRLVIYFTHSRAWRFGRSDAGYRFEYNGDSVDFDIDEVFRYIPRKRVTDIETYKNTVEISLDCECAADAFELRNGLIVLDFRDGAPDEFSRFETPLETSTDTNHPSEHQILDNPTLELLAPLVPAPHPETIVPDFSNVLSNGQVERLQTTMLENLSRAMSQGLVNTVPVNQNEIGKNLATTHDMPSMNHEATPNKHDETAESQTIEDALSGVSIQTQMQLDASRQTKLPEVAMLNCPNPILLDIASWGDPDAIVEGLAQRRDALMSSDFLASTDGILALARYYAWLGFGSEARAVMSLGIQDKATEEVLHIMSGVMDGLPISTASSWSRCQGAAQLWSFLAAETLEPLRSPAKTSVVRSFERLPDHLRQHIGPMLFNRFIENEDKDGAETIRQSISRATERESPQVEFLQAKALLDSGQVEDALQEFSRLAKGSDGLATQALLALGETSLQNDTELSEWALEGLRAQAEIHKGTVEGQPIRDLLLAHLVAGKRIAEVSSYLKNTPFAATEDDQARLLALLEMALPAADDTIFAELAVQYRDLIRNTPEAAALMAYTSTRFRDLGFETTASSFQTNGANSDQNNAAETVNIPLNEPLSTHRNENSEAITSDVNNHISKVGKIVALPLIDQAVVSIPANEGLLAAARTRRQRISELLATVPEVN